MRRLRLCGGDRGSRPDRLAPEAPRPWCHEPPARPGAEQRRDPDRAGASTTTAALRSSTLPRRSRLPDDRQVVDPRVERRLVTRRCLPRSVRDRQRRVGDMHADHLDLGSGDFTAIATTLCRAAAARTGTRSARVRDVLEKLAPEDPGRDHVGVVERMHEREPPSRARLAMPTHRRRGTAEVTTRPGRAPLGWAGRRRVRRPRRTPSVRAAARAPAHGGPRAPTPTAANPTRPGGGFAPAPRH